MPVVPIRPRTDKRAGAHTRALPQVSPTFVAMAAAQMMKDRQVAGTGADTSPAGRTPSPEAAPSNSNYTASSATLPTANR